MLLHGHADLQGEAPSTQRVTGLLSLGLRFRLKTKTNPEQHFSGNTVAVFVSRRPSVRLWIVSFSRCRFLLTGTPPSLRNASKTSLTTPPRKDALLGRAPADRGTRLFFCVRSRKKKASRRGKKELPPPPCTQPLMGAGDPVEWVTVAGLIFWGGDAT